MPTCVTVCCNISFWRSCRYCFGKICHRPHLSTCYEDWQASDRAVASDETMSTFQHGKHKLEAYIGASTVGVLTELIRSGAGADVGDVIDKMTLEVSTHMISVEICSAAR